MIGQKVVIKRGGTDEAEKPFWISFADLMTALTVLFLVVMGVALLAVTRTVTETEAKEAQHRADIDEIMSQLKEASKDYPGINVDKTRNVIDYGDRARFPYGRSSLTPDQEQLLRQFAPVILAHANAALGKRILRRVVIEGYTDPQGTYLANLNLSLQRSQRVLCAMFATTGLNLLSETQKEDIRSLFLVGGYSFNAVKATDEESRRVEMRVEFLGVGETRPIVIAGSGNFGQCALQ